MEEEVVERDHRSVSHDNGRQLGWLYTSPELDFLTRERRRYTTGDRSVVSEFASR